MNPRLPRNLTALVPRGSGHQFVFYGDACSGIAGARHEKTFAATNAVVSQLDPQPEFIVFPGDEIRGLTADEHELKRQWRYWFDVEMGWLDQEQILVYHTTSNHTTYSVMSETVFAEVMSHLPRNGPADQQGLSYFIRRENLLMVFIHTAWSGIGGEGHLETAWLNDTLINHADARHKLVIGHHPAFPVNGFSGEFQREIGADYSQELWRILMQHGVLAYLCSHILAFDVQVHGGVLQILSAGVGTAHRMPEPDEYLHCVQMALDDSGLRYQVIDQSSVVRERLSWPFELPPADAWQHLHDGRHATAKFAGIRAPAPDQIFAVHFEGVTSDRSSGAAQTLVAAFDDDSELAPLWIGLTGRSMRLTVTISPNPGRSPHYWFGPDLTPGEPLDVQIALHPSMGPGGVLWRTGRSAPWSSFTCASSWGAERLAPSAFLSVGHGKGGPSDAPFCGHNLTVHTIAERCT